MERRTRTKSKLVGLGLAAITGLAVTTSPASAAIADLQPASVGYSQAVTEVTLINADATSNTSDNLSCSPPTVGGTMVNPRTQYVLGEVYGTDVIFAEWDCVNRNTGTSFTITGRVVDYAFYSGRWNNVGSSPYESSTSTLGVAAITPYKMNQFPGGSPALNTWHYARFDGVTSTGKRMAGVSELFSVSGN